MASLSGTDLKNGRVFSEGGEVFIVMDYSHNFRGRGGSVVKVKVRNIRTGNVLEKSYRENQKVEDVDTRKKNLQYLYSDGSSGYFMDPDTYEQISIPVSAIGDDVKYLKEGETAAVLFIDDSPVSIDLPKAVELKVEYTEPAVRGNTANNAVKKAKLENGLETDVPLFVKIGDTVKISTETGAYLSRA